MRATKRTVDGIVGADAFAAGDRGLIAPVDVDIAFEQRLARRIGLQRIGRKGALSPEAARLLGLAVEPRRLQELWRVAPRGEVVALDRVQTIKIKHRMVTRPEMIADGRVRRPLESV